MNKKNLIICIASLIIVVITIAIPSISKKNANTLVSSNNSNIPQTNVPSDNEELVDNQTPLDNGGNIQSQTKQPQKTPSNNNSNSNTYATKSPSTKTPQSNYTNTGTYSVTYLSQNDYTIFYPKNISSESKSFPLITWGNGIGTTPRVYSQLISHIASHGFVVVASNSGNVGSGSEMVAGIDYMKSLNSDSSSQFYNKIDLSNVGATGHSLGGRGTLNAASKDSRIKCIVPIQPAGADNIKNVKCPMFLITSTNDTVLNSDQFVKPLFNGSTVPTVYASLVGEPHTAPATCCKKLQGYVTAWLSMYLKSDSSAKNYFIGNNSIISQDSNWTDINIKNF